MVRVLIVYDSRTGNTEKMAYAVAEGVREEGIEVEVKRVDEASIDELPQYDGYHNRVARLLWAGDG